MTGEADKALRYAYKLLSYRQRSIKELGDRLRRKGFSPACVRQALERLEGLGYLDDGALALSLKGKAGDVKLLGSAGARQYLMRMGIPRDTVEDALADYDELAGARRLVEKKMKTLKDYPRAVIRKRLLGYLKRRGYSGDTVRKSLRFDMKEEEL
jgi:regulatory protein